MSTRRARSREARLQGWLAKGEEAFHAGKTKDAIIEAGSFDLEARNAWLIGWRNAGGNILVAGHRKGIDAARNANKGKETP